MENWLDLLNIGKNALKVVSRIRWHRIEENCHIFREILSGALSTVGHRRDDGMSIDGVIWRPENKL